MKGRKAPVFTYTGDTGGAHRCIIVTPGGLASKVRITGHDSPLCTLPVGAVVTVPNKRLSR
jgi:hypothetical protein